MKGGVAGNRAGALELESLSSVPLLSAIAIIASAPFLFLRTSLGVRTCVAVVSCFVLGIVLIAMGMEIELGASQRCFAK